MGELPSEDTTSFVDMPQMEVIDVYVTDDSPLAHALRRRKRESERQEQMIAGHDSSII